MPLSTFSFERPVPARPWRGMAFAVAGIVAAMAGGWELACRAMGYGPSIDDTPDAWAEQRAAVQPDSIVIIGDSRAWFGFDLDELERGLGRRPLQLALAGSCAYPVLADLAADPNFRGTVLCSLVPGMFFAPGGPLLETSERALKRYRTWTLAQRASHFLYLPLDATLACLNAEALTLGELLKRLPIPDRPHALVGPPMPPYFNSMDRERRARMFPPAEQPGPLQTRVRDSWIPLFTPPPPPSFVPKEAFLAQMQQAFEARFADTSAAVEKIRQRGGNVIFIRFPMTGPLKAHEDQMTPRAAIWDRVIKETGAPGIYFEDHPELAGFDCPEWSHLSTADSIEFTRRIVPHLRPFAGSGLVAKTPAPASGQ
jgi:hypothetical protein